MAFQPRPPVIAGHLDTYTLTERQVPMALERTFSIIKPDATKRNLTGKIVAKFEEAGLRVVASKRIHLTKAQAGAFYAVHKDRPFYDELCTFMASAPIVAQVLEGENAIAKNREVMGATNPPLTPPLVPSAQSLPNLWAKILFMGPMRLKPPRLRLPTSFLGWNWSADRSSI